MRERYVEINGQVIAQMEKVTERWTEIQGNGRRCTEKLVDGRIKKWTDGLTKTDIHVPRGRVRQ